jgi:hypothetical protein
MHRQHHARTHTQKHTFPHETASMSMPGRLNLGAVFFFLNYTLCVERVAIFIHCTSACFTCESKPCLAERVVRDCNNGGLETQVSDTAMGFMALYKSGMPVSGQVTLGGNRAATSSGSLSNYVVVVAPAQEHGSGEESLDPLACVAPKWSCHTQHILQILLTCNFVGLFSDNLFAVGMGMLAVDYPSGTEGNEAFEGSMGFTFEGESSI